MQIVVSDLNWHNTEAATITQLAFAFAFCEIILQYEECNDDTGGCFRYPQHASGNETL